MATKFKSKFKSKAAKAREAEVATAQATAAALEGNRDRGFPNQKTTGAKLLDAVVGTVTPNRAVMPKDIEDNPVFHKSGLAFEVDNGVVTIDTLRQQITVLKEKKQRRDLTPNEQKFLRSLNRWVTKLIGTGGTPPKKGAAPDEPEVDEVDEVTKSTEATETEKAGE